jgi:hypothetical protein
LTHWTNISAIILGIVVGIIGYTTVVLTVIQIWDESLENTPVDALRQA